MRCMDDNCDTWLAQPFIPEVDEEHCRLISELPALPNMRQHRPPEHHHVRRLGME